MECIYNNLFWRLIGWPLIMTIIAGYPLVVEEIGHNIPILFHIAMIGLPVTAYLMAVAMYKREIIDSQYKKEASWEYLQKCKILL